MTSIINDIVIKELNTHTDERGFFREIIRNTDDFFTEGFGQWSHSLMFDGVIKAKRKSDAMEGDFAGDVHSIDTEKILGHLDKKTIPVISPVGVGQDNKLYNINADYAGTEIAIALKAAKLIL